MTGSQSRRSAVGAPLVWLTAGLLMLLAMALAVGASGQEFHQRGDASCGAALTAADLVATARALGGVSSCGNDDCDRDGALTPADLACAAGCLFRACPVPAHAPRATGIDADSAPEIVPGSVVRLAVANLGPLDANKRVTVNGLEAEVVEQTAAELLVALPVDLPTGPAELVVIDGDLAGAPIAIEVAPPVPLGAPDTFDGLLGLVDTALARLLALDVEAGFGDNAPIIRQEYARYRTELAEQRATLAGDPSLDEAARIVLDAVIDASGAPEQLRALIVELEAMAAVPAAAGTAGTLNPAYRAFQHGARTIKVAASVARAAGGAAAATAGTISAAPIIAAIAAGLAINAGAVLVGSNPLTPLITGIAYVDANGDPRSYPTGGGVAIVRGHNFDTVTTILRIRIASGSYSGTDATALADAISFRLPDNVGFCGKVTFALERPGGFVSNPVSARVQPELLFVPSSLFLGKQLTGEARGASDCFHNETLFTGAVSGRSFNGFSGVRQLLTIPPEILPGDYKVGLLVEGLRSRPEDDLAIDLRNPLGDFMLECPSTISLPDTGVPSTSVPRCQVIPQPRYSVRPQPSRFDWTSSRSSVVAVPAQTDGLSAALTARNIGTTMVSAALVADIAPFRVLASAGPVAVTVVDHVPPRISILSSAGSTVAPGASIPVAITASDNAGLLDVQLEATGDAVASGGSQSSLECVGKKLCGPTLTVTLKEGGFTQSTVTITATARDAGANTATSNTLSFTIGRDTSCPTVTIMHPPAGGTVNAGETVTVVAMARDDGPDATGVKSFTYTATGAALTAPVALGLPLPMPQAAPTLRFNFTVKPPEELRGVDDKTITISVEALDAADPPNTCGPQTIAVEVIGVLDQCNGGITTDNPAGYIGEPFTITVALTGEGADEITRVTSINPGGQFDLAPQGGGVYTVTLFYQGTGAFSLRFVALDAGGEERCSGSIGLESLGPRPEAGTAARARANMPAGGSLR